MKSVKIQPGNMDEMVENRNGIKPAIKRNNIVKKLVIKNFGKFVFYCLLIIV